MTATYGPFDRTSLNALSPNLDTGDVADPALRLAYFQYLADYGDAMYSGVKADIASKISAGALSALGIINVKDYGASGSDTTTTGNLASGSKVLVVTSTTSFAVGQGISVAGAGEAGADLVTSITSIVGTNVFLADEASTTVSGATVSHDDAAAIQAALDAISNAGGGTLIIPDGIYAVTADDDTGQVLNVPSDIKIQLGKNAEIKLNANNLEGYQIFNVVEVDNVHIEGGTITGDRSTHTGATGEWGVGIEVRSSTNVIIKDMLIRNCWGDGIYIGSTDDGAVYSENVSLIGCTLDNNRRNNMSIVSLIGGYFNHTTFSHANGTNPQHGVDIELNNANQFACRLIFDSCLFLNNTSVGLATAGDSTNVKKDLIVRNCIFDGNGTGAVLGNNFDGLIVDGNEFRGHLTSSVYTLGIKVGRNANITGNAFKDNAGGGIALQDAAFNVNITGNSFDNNGTKSSIIIQSGSNVLVSTNTIYRCGEAGVRVTAIVGACRIANNVIHGSLGGDSFASGVYISGGNDIVIDGNKVTDIGDGLLKIGIFIRFSTSSNVVIINNDVKGAGASAGIADNGTDTIIGLNRMKDGSWTTTPN